MAQVTTGCRLVSSKMLETTPSRGRSPCLVALADSPASQFVKKFALLISRSSLTCQHLHPVCILLGDVHLIAHGDDLLKELRSSMGLAHENDDNDGAAAGGGGIYPLNEICPFQKFPAKT